MHLPGFENLLMSTYRAPFPGNSSLLTLFAAKVSRNLLDEMGSEADPSNVGHASRTHDQQHSCIDS